MYLSTKNHNCFDVSISTNIFQKYPLFLGLLTTLNAFLPQPQVSASSATFSWYSSHSYNIWFYAKHSWQSLKLNIFNYKGMSSQLMLNPQFLYEQYNLNSPNPKSYHSNYKFSQINIYLN